MTGCSARQSGWNSYGRVRTGLVGLRFGGGESGAGIWTRVAVLNIFPSLALPSLRNRNNHGTIEILRGSFKPR
jgi:hypothetical protein